MKMPENKPADNQNGYYAPFDNSSYYNEEVQNGLPNGQENGTDPENEFSEYMWMEHMEEFDREVMKRLEEEALMEECIEAMLEDLRTDARNDHPANIDRANDAAKLLDGLQLNDEATVTARNSKLNPLAAEFVPSSTSDCFQCPKPN